MTDRNIKSNRINSGVALTLLGLLFLASCQQQAARTRPLRPPEQQTEVHALAANSSPALKAIVDGAVDQVGKTTSYDPSY